ncbi:MAG TPA: hypothetical protein VIX19_06795 [Terriglobales bacterium]
MALHPNLKRSSGAALSLLLLSFVLHNNDNKGLSVLAWIGGGSILFGGYKVFSESVDLLDQLADRFFWNKRNPRP